VGDRADDDDPDGIRACSPRSDWRWTGGFRATCSRSTTPPAARDAAPSGLRAIRAAALLVDASPQSPLRLLRHLKALEEVRDALEHDAADQFGAQLVRQRAGLPGADRARPALPLTSILFLAETLMQERSGPVKRAAAAPARADLQRRVRPELAHERYHRAGPRGDQLADDRPTPLSVSELLESGANRPSHRGEKGLTVGVHAPHHRPALGMPSRCGGAPEPHHQRAEFTERGSVDIVATEKSPTRIRFSVRDTGPGINPRLVDLFQPFRRIARVGRYLFSGTASDLALTRRLVRAMGSELCLETRPNVGTQFWFDLELPPADAGAVT